MFAWVLRKFGLIGNGPVAKPEPAAAPTQPAPKRGPMPPNGDELAEMEDQLNEHQTKLRSVKADAEEQARRLDENVKKCREKLGNKGASR